ncbi:unnamed protein product [Clonostachys chloroleuca]|uniref:Zn(2)-C6 fungal-type domain-containing protein n=1 Tax=Clonostachys chloroleuca TaxID=1926264 RepID=A0AA35MAX5_9HYPO|nr:unnamed protein product [Clonostachys chloroleuca]
MVDHTESAVRRRRRPATACNLCRRRKLRCNREQPCGNCIRSRTGECIYHTGPLPKTSPRQQGFNQLGEGDLGSGSENSTLVEKASNRSGKLTAATSSPHAHPNDSSPQAQGSAQELDDLKNRIRKLEDQLSKTSIRSPTIRYPGGESTSEADTSTALLDGTFHFQQQAHEVGQPQAVARGFSHKSRVFGKSHWVNTWSSLNSLGGGTPKALTGVAKCKQLARVIKSRWSPKWPTEFTTELPRKDIADDLVDCYLRTTESVYRVLHIPSFRRDYESLWISDGKKDTGFLALLKLVLAIGAVTYDDKFSMRMHARRWIYEVQAWLSEPEFKSRLDIQFMQTRILLLLARDLVKVGGDSTWVSTGEVIRTAVSLGLHRDPKRLPEKPKLICEMRRRLWNTVLEIDTQSSLHNGSMHSIYMEESDTEMPGNFNDEQLLHEGAIPSPETEFTQMSFILILRKSLELRRGIVRFLNSINSRGTYDETLQLDTRLRKMYKDLYKNMHGYTIGASPSTFSLNFVDLLLQRYILALHAPYFGPSLSEIRYSFSRKMVIEVGLKIWCTIYPNSATRSSVTTGAGPASSSQDFWRWVTSGSGFFRYGFAQVIALIAIELRAQIREQECLGPAPLRSDLMNVLGQGLDWCIRCIERGETNVRGYMLQSVAKAQIEGLQQGLPNEEVARSMILSAEECADHALALLQDLFAQTTHCDENTNIPEQFAATNPMSAPGIEWDFEMPDEMFNFDMDDPTRLAVDERMVNSMFGRFFHDVSFLG